MAFLEWRVHQALAVRFPLLRHRVAKIADGLDEGRRVRRFDLDRVAIIRQFGRALQCQGLHERLTDSLVAARAKGRVEVGRRDERRNTEQRRQAMLRVNAFAIFELALERQR